MTLLVSGCGKNDSEALPPAAPTPAKSVDISAAPGETTAAQTAAVPPPGETAAPAAQPAQLSEDEPLGGKGRPLTEQEVMLLNYGISMFKEEKGRFPATLQEAVASHHITRLPELPAGQKLDYNPQNGSVKVGTIN